MYQWIGSGHREPVRVPFHIPTGYITALSLRQTTDPFIWLYFIGAKYTVICNRVVLTYIEWGLSRATTDIWIWGPICSDHESVIELRVDSSKSIPSTGGSDISIIGYRLISYMTLHISRCHMLWCWWHLISNIDESRAIIQWDSTTCRLGSPWAMMVWLQ